MTRPFHGYQHIEPWPWWSLFLKTLTLLITFKQWVLKHWHFIWAFLVSISDHNLIESIVIVVLVVNFSHVLLLLQNHWAFQPKLAQSNLVGKRGFKFVQMKRPTLFQREIIKKIHWQIFKIYFSRTSGLSTKYSWVKDIQICSNEGPSLFLRGDN